MSLPLENIKVLEFTHAVMGPAGGLILADLGAEVIHIEPVDGDNTRRLKGFGTGYFPFYNRNKQSLAIDIKSEEGKEIILELVKSADIILENFGPGTMERLGYGYEVLKKINPKLIYCSLKGFLSGPYEKRHAMDEVVQMMGGLAYMTGPVGQPLRAGTSVIDINGGMFGVIGILTALYQREKTGEGQFLKSSLFETTAFLMGQHMAYSAITKEKVPPMPARVSAWSIYKTFETKDNSLVFVGIISEKHWIRFCDVFSRIDWKENPDLATNNLRIEQRDWFLDEVNAHLKTFTKAEIIQKCEQADIPFAPIAEVEDLFNDIQLIEGKSLLQTTLPDGTNTQLPKIPIEGEYFQQSLRKNPPQIGQDNLTILSAMGLDSAQIQALKSKGIIS